MLLSIRNLPFTIMMLVILVVAGIYSDSHAGLLDPQIERDAGHSMRLMIEGGFYRLLTSLLFTAGGWRFYASLAMLAFAVGYAEWNFGTLRSVVTFFGVHLMALILLFVIVLFANQIFTIESGRRLWEVRDVGPSAGYYGCLGMAIAGLRRPVRGPLIALILAVLLSRAGYSFAYLPEKGRMLSADLTHLIAISLGMYSWWAFPKK